MNILWVALGGAAGAVCRYGISLLPIHTTFPIATFVTNLLGAFIIGLVVGWSEKNDLPNEVILFTKTGFCGGFTTFSTFSLESMNLISDGKYFVGGGYMILSLLCCVVGVALGKWCIR